MSAFIVDNKTINRVLSMIDLDRNGTWIKRRIKEKTGLDMETVQGLEQLGRALLMLNIDAVNQRYDEDNNSTLLLNEYKYSVDLSINKIRAYKSAQCLNYQCSEGNIPETELYKCLEEIEHTWANDIVTALPAYEQAKWS